MRGRRITGRILSAILVLLLMLPLLVGGALAVQQRANDANGGWVLPGEDGAAYLGTEYGLYHLDADGAFCQYTAYPALWLQHYGEFILYAEYERNDSAGLGICAFDLTPLSEPYPTEVLYDGSASYVQVDAAGEWLYFLGDGVLWRASLTPLTDSTGDGGPIVLQPEAIAWESLAATGGDAAPPPHEAPQTPALSPHGLYVMIAMSGARHQEFVYCYRLDGKEAQKIDVLTDGNCRSMFWFDPAGLLFFRGEATTYGSLEADGIYALAPDSGQLLYLFDDQQSDFTVWCDTAQVSGARPYPVLLVLAGETGVYTVDIGGETAGEPMCLYKGPARLPNVVHGYVYFRAPSAREDAQYDYFRVPVDGTTGVERLDFVNEVIEPL